MRVAIAIVSLLFFSGIGRAADAFSVNFTSGVKRVGPLEFQPSETQKAGKIPVVDLKDAIAKAGGRVSTNIDVSGRIFRVVEGKSQMIKFVHRPGATNLIYLLNKDTIALD